MNKALLVTTNIGLIFLGVALWRMPQAYVEEQTKQKAREQAELQEKIKPLLESVDRQNEQSAQIRREALDNHKKFVEQNRQNLQEPPKSSTPLPSTSPQTKVVPPSSVPVSVTPTPQTSSSPVPSTNTRVPQEVIDSIAGKREPGTFTPFTPLVSDGLPRETPKLVTPSFKQPDFDTPSPEVAPYNDVQIYDTKDPQQQDNQK